MLIPMVSRLKILSKMDIAERRIPQDGAFSMQLERTHGELREKIKVDVRVSTVPSVFGEKMVMRLLNKGAIPLQMEKLGLTERQAKDFQEIHS